MADDDHAAEPAAIEAPPAPSSLLSGSGGAGGGEPPSGNGAEGVPAPSGAPAEYGDFTFPEGVAADPEILGEFKDWARTSNLSQGGAQAALDIATRAMNRAHTAVFDQWRETQEQWVKAIKTDPEFGGARFDRNIAVCAKALDRFGGQPLREALAFTGAGNHPEIVKFVHRVGLAISEGSFVTEAGGPRGNPEDRLYPTMNKE